MCIPASKRHWPCWQTQRGGTIVSVVAAAAHAAAAHAATLCTRASFSIGLSPSLGLSQSPTLGLSQSLTLGLSLRYSLCIFLNTRSPPTPHLHTPFPHPMPAMPPAPPFLHLPACTPPAIQPNRAVHPALGSRAPSLHRHEPMHALEHF